jgi:signal transduction histidine kinase
MLARLSAGLRRHPQFVDLLWMLPVAAIAQVMTPSRVAHTGAGYHAMVSFPVHEVLLVTSCAPLIWRRRSPRTVFTIVTLLAFAQWLAGIAPAAHNLAVMIAMYTIAAECAFRWALAAGLTAQIGAALAVYSAWSDQHDRASWKTMIPFSVFIWAIWLGGLYLNTRRKYTRSLEERAERLERERDAQVQVAAAAERARIAREMHDVIAHSISVMVVQADGAAYTVEADPKRARLAMDAIGTTGRQALMEMRRMLGVLRDSGGAVLAPQPGVAQINELLEQVRSAGLRVDLTIEGVPTELTAGMQLAVYRIVQEALTNTRKHAGPGASAHVALHYGDQAVEVRVRDDGRSAAPADGRGHGLVGMRERVAVYDGSVSAEPAVGGGFEVIARFPLKQEVTA